MPIVLQRLSLVSAPDVGCYVLSQDDLEKWVLKYEVLVF